MTEQNHSAGSTPDTGGLREHLEKNWRVALGIGAAVIVLATLLAYLPALRASFVWDDDYYVSNNRLLHSWDGLQRIWVMTSSTEYPLPQYYPMTHTSFWLEYRLWGLNPAGYHVVNVLLHIGNALLVWLLLRKLSVPGAWLAAAIFALHPINVESVAWIAERKNVLSLLFFLSSLYVYLRFAGVIRGAPRVEKPVLEPTDEPATEIEWFTLPDEPVRLYLLAAVLFLCALFSKTTTNSMPAVALLIIWWKRGRMTVKDLLPLLPLFAAGIGMGMLTAHMEVVRVGVGQRPGPWVFSPTVLGQFGARCIIAGNVLWFYVYKMLLPFGLLFNYPRWEINPGSIVQYLPGIAAAFVLAGVVLARKRLGGGAVVAILCYAGTLFPALGFFNVWPMQFSFVADHFVYISSIAFIALVAALAVRYVKLEAVAAIAAPVLLVLLGLSFSQAGIFKDEKTLWADTWKRSGNTSWMAANNYGSLAYNEGNLVYADEWFKAAIKARKGGYPEAYVNRAQIAHARANILQEMKARSSATQSSTNVARPTTQPEEYYQQAIAFCEEALRADPNYTPAHFELARIRLSQGRPAEAVTQFLACIERNPRHAMAYEALGSLALDQDKIDDAIRYLLRAAEIDPDSSSAHASLGTALLKAGKVEQGLNEWDQALRLDPDNWELPKHFGDLMAMSGKYPLAAAYFQKAIKIHPDAVEAITNLGVMAALEGFPAEARSDFEKAMTIDPTYTKAREDLEALNSGRLHPTTTRSSTRPAALPTTR